MDKTVELNLNVLQLCDNINFKKIPKSKLWELSDRAKKKSITIELGTRGLELDDIKEYIKIAEILDSKLIRTLINSNKYQPSIKEAKKSLKQLTSFIEEKGIKIAIENHDSRTNEELLELLNYVDSSNVGVCLDTVNSFGALECPEKVINQLLPYTINIHIKDFVIKRKDHMMGFEILGTPAGDGVLDIGKILTMVDEFEIDPNIILELWTPPEDNIKKTIIKEDVWATKSIKYLRRKMNEKK